MTTQYKIYRFEIFGLVFNFFGLVFNFFGLVFNFFGLVFRRFFKNPLISRDCRLFNDSNILIL